MKDKLTIKAKREGFKARSAYKLIEINKKYRLLKRGNKVLDLGCWPGSWLQVCRDIGCKVIGIDLRKTEIKGADTFQMNIFDDKIFELVNFDAIISDVAPTTSGNIEIDQYKSYELSKRAFDICKRLLKKNGNFLVKIFQSGDSNKLLNEMKKNYVLAKTVKPSASKKESKEIYFIGLGFK